MKNFVITIGREFGSGGHNLGQSLAKELGIPCYDRHLIEEAAVCGEFKMEELEEADEIRAFVADYLGQLVAALVFAWAPDRIMFGGGVMSTPGLLAEVEFAARRAVAGYGSAVVMGAAGYLVPAALEHAGLEGALLMARDVARL